MDAKQIEIDESFVIGEDEEFKDAEILSETKSEIITNDDEKTKELSGISALLANLDTETDVSIIVTRLNDRQYKKQFRLPCEVDSQLEVLSWDGEAFPDGHYEYIQKKYGGGHYRLQLRYNGGFKQAWKVVLADLPEMSEKERLQKEQDKPHEPVKIEVAQPQFIPTQQAEKPLSRNDFFAQIIEEEKQRAELRSLFAPPSPPPSEAPAQTVTKDSIKMAVVEKALNEPELIKMAIRSVFDIPPEAATETEEQNTFLDIFKYVAGHPGESKVVLDTVLGSVAGVIAPLASFIMPKPPAQEINLNTFNQPRTEQPPVSIPLTQPQPPQTAEFEPFVIEDTLPFIEIGE